jgi:hypothetical protein
MRMMICRRKQAIGHLEKALGLAKTRSKSHANMEIAMLTRVDAGSHDFSKPPHRV